MMKKQMHLDRDENFGFAFCIDGMYRGCITKKGGGETFICKNQRLVRILIVKNRFFLLKKIPYLSPRMRTWRS